jgi:hypothetical protein
MPSTAASGSLLIGYPYTSARPRLRSLKGKRVGRVDGSEVLHAFREPRSGYARVYCLEIKSHRC